LPLTAPSKQTIVPAMYQSGRMIGFYSIALRTFTGAETTLTLTDNVVVPIKSVTIDKDPTKPGQPQQYMAAVFPDGTPNLLRPWASQDLREPSEGYLRMYSMPTETWMLRSQMSILQVALTQGMAGTVAAPTTPTAPTVTTPATLQWAASVSYEALLGDCPFFDFNWVTLFKASSSTEAIRIVVTSNPGPTAGHTNAPMVAQIIGIPTAVGQGVVRFDTIRIMKMQDDVPAGTYSFGFNIYGENGLVTPSVLTLTVV
jgi:hypothetical protein